MSEKLPIISTTAELLEIIRVKGQLTNHEIEDSPHTEIYGTLINQAVDLDLLDCFWSDLIETTEHFNFYLTQTWRLKDNANPKTE